MGIQVMAIYGKQKSRKTQDEMDSMYQELERKESKVSTQEEVKSKGWMKIKLHL